MAKDLLDFSKFKKIFEDDKNTHLKHPKGHTIIVAHVALNPKLKKQIADLPMHPEKMVEMAKDIMEQLPHQKMAEGGKAEKPAVSRIDMNYKDVTKRIPQLTEAANKLSAGKMSAAEYDALVNKHKPVEAYGFVPQPASREDAMRALNESKRKMYGMTSEMKAGEPADLRLDIPAYKDHGVWVNSIHRKDAPTVYGSVSSVNNAQMVPSSEKALRVAAGGPKAPFAVIRGEWNPMEEKEAVAKAQKYLKHKDWKQVGYDPERHGYFYDRESMQPIEGAEQVIQIGPLVLAKKPRYAKKEEQLFADGGEVDKPFKGYNSEKHSRTGGLNDSYREKYNREHGSNLKRPVTGTPEAGSKDAARKKSFCARMKGVKGPTSEGGELTPKGAALKRWNCHAHGGRIEDEHDEECQHYAKGGSVDDFDEDTGLDKNYKGPLTSRGEPLSIKEGLKKSEWEFGENPVLHTKKGSIPLRFPKKSDSTYQDILRSKELNEPHEEAMGQWMPRNKALQEGKPIDDRTLALTNMMSTLSANTGTPQMELMFSRVLDATRKAGIDPRSPEFAKAILPGGKVHKILKEMDASKESPEQAREYFEGPAREAFIQKAASKTTGRKPGDIVSVQPSMKMFGERLSNIPAAHQYYLQVANKHGADAVAYAEELARDKVMAEAYKNKAKRLQEQGKEVPPFQGPEGALASVGLGTKTNLFSHEMAGGGNSMIPDTHILRSMFGLDIRNPGDAAALEHIKNTLWEAKNYPLLKQLNEYYQKEHPAHEYAAEKYGFGKGNPQATFPAHWLHWNTVAPYERAQGIGRPSTARNLTTHGNIFKALNEPHEYMAEGGPVPSPSPHKEEAFKRNAQQFEKGFNAGEDIGQSFKNIKNALGFYNGGAIRHYANAGEVKPLTAPVVETDEQVDAVRNALSSLPSFDTEDMEEDYEQPAPKQGPRTNYAAPLPGMAGGPPVYDEPEDVAEEAQPQPQQPQKVERVEYPGTPRLLTQEEEAQGAQYEQQNQRENQIASLKQQAQKRIQQLYNIEMGIKEAASTAGGVESYSDPSNYFGSKGEPPSNFDEDAYEKAEKRFAIEQKEKNAQAQAQRGQIEKQNIVRARAGLAPIPTGQPSYGAAPKPAPTAAVPPSPLTAAQAPVGNVGNLPEKVGVAPQYDSRTGTTYFDEPTVPEFGTQTPEQIAVDAYNREADALRRKKDIDIGVAKARMDVEKKQLESQQKVADLLVAQIQQEQSNNDKFVKAYMNETIDPMKAWTDKSVPGKIATILGVLVGGFATGRDGVSENPALKLLQYEIDKEIEAQKTRLARYPEAIKMGKERLTTVQNAALTLKSQYGELATRQLADKAARYGVDASNIEFQKAISALQQKYVQGPLGMIAFNKLSMNPNLGDDDAANMILQARNFNPEYGKELADKYLVGYGFSTKSLNPIIATQVLNLDVFEKQATYLLNLIDAYKAGKYVPSPEKTEIKTIAKALMKDLAHANAMDLTESSAKWLKDQIGDPVSLWNNIVTDNEALRSTLNDLKIRKESALKNLGYPESSIRVLMQKAEFKNKMDAMSRSVMHLEPITEYASPVPPAAPVQNQAAPGMGTAQGQPNSSVRDFRPRSP